METKNPESFVPQSDLGFYILVSLVEKQPRYGIDIQKTIIRLSEGDVEAPTGSLYPALRRMTDQGMLLAEYPPPPYSPHFSYRYSLTPFGIQVLEVHTNWQQQLLNRTVPKLIELGIISHPPGR